MKQPVAVGICSTGDQFWNYNGGILNDVFCCWQHNHSVTVVGYGQENGQNYFILKNNWGVYWGEQGYMRVSADVGGVGVCGILMEGSFPTTD